MKYPNLDSRQKRKWDKSPHNILNIITIAAVVVIAVCLAVLFGPSSKIEGSGGTEPTIATAVAETEVVPTEETVHQHSWKDATCEEPQICKNCGEKKGSPLGHKWIEATYDTPKTCRVCNETEEAPLEKPSIRNIPPTGMIAAGNYHSVYLKSNGTVYAVGSEKLSEYDNRGSRCDTESWKDIVAVSASSHTVGLCEDGTVVAVGVNRYGQCNVDSWENIIAVYAGDYHTVGLHEDGSVVAVGNNSHGQCDVSHWKNIIAVAAAEETTFGLTEDGRVLSVGKKNYGSDWNNIIAISAGPYHLVGLRENGTVVQTGSCDAWDQNTNNWSEIIAISAGSAHTVGLRANGTVAACGNDTTNRGQCKISSWTDIIQIGAGMYHTVGLKSDGTIVAEGNNGYGQLNITN